MDDLITIAGQFKSEGQVLDVREYGRGNVNDTFLVTLDCDGEKHFILQRINTHVFHHPERIMLNMRTLTEHVRERLKRKAVSSSRRWEVPRVFQAKNGQDYFVDARGSFWRAMSFISGSRCYETVQSIEHAREAGYALGRFHDLLSDLNPQKLHDTLEGFHITPQYLWHYDEVLTGKEAQAASAQASNGTQSYRARPSHARSYCARFVEERRGWASVLEDAKRQGKLCLRPIHGDPKINNFMIGERTGQAISIVDLDTVKPGLIHYDIGDCLRSCCNPVGEETTCVKDVRFDADLCRAILQGYLAEARSFLTEADYAYMYDCVRLIAFELGLRFFTDYLEGNVYFKVKHAEHNLQRALVQFRLTESIESQEADIRAIIDDLKRQVTRRGLSQMNTEATEGR